MIIPRLTFVYDRRKRAGRNKAAAVELKVYADHKQKYLTTGVRLLPREWANGEVSACRPDYAELNELLHTFKRKVTEILTQMIQQGSLDLDALPNMINDQVTSQQTFLEYARMITQRKVRTLAVGTYKRYIYFLRFLEDWGGIKYFSDVSDINVLKMDDALRERGLKESSRYNYHKILKVFVLQAVNDGLVQKNPYFRLGIKRGDEGGIVRHLTPKEFEKIESCDLDREVLRKVRDLFLFQTYTMMAYADLVEFSWKKCYKEKGQVMYKEKRKKTKQEFVIPLVAPALEILERYRYKLPIISDQQYNRYLKLVVSYAGINKDVTSHWARHTGATILVNKGVPMHIIQHILGHASIRETERTYAKVLDSTIAESMANVW